MAFKFGTKAETLERIAALDTPFQIPQLFYFSVSQWRDQRKSLLKKIGFLFSKLIAVRSSAKGEDGKEKSMAGVFQTRLSVDPSKSENVEKAISDVISSYSGADERDQVLIQTMAANVIISGVIMTRSLDDGAPYYVINYDDESGKVDSITGGTHVCKTVLVYRHYKEDYFDSIRVKQMVGLARALEEICSPVPLDIEFGIGADGESYLFQVRRISTTHKWHLDIEHKLSMRIPFVEKFIRERSSSRPGIWGSRTILGNMSDWNPAELIGVTPRPLAASLFQEIITERVWSLAREKMGYRKLPPEDLMVIISGQPYLDIRNSFNSFLPEGIKKESGEKLVSAWLQRLDQHPEFHDKVEFEVALTVHDFCFEEKFNRLYKDVLTRDEFKEFKACLLELTNNCLDVGLKGSLSTSLSYIDMLEKKQKEYPMELLNQNNPLQILSLIKQLTNDCKLFGTLPFSIIARHGFIAETFVRSCIKRGAITPERVNEFKSSIKTVMSRLNNDYKSVCENKKSEKEFMDNYGHLRPGTYDITSLRYADRDIFDDSNLPVKEEVVRPFSPKPDELDNINSLLRECGITCIDSAGLFQYIKTAVAAREYAKYVFTKNLSNMIEAVKCWGRIYDLDPDDLSFIPFKTIMETLINPLLNDPGHYFLDISERGRRDFIFANSIKLSYIIRGVRDIYVVPIHRAIPNFVSIAKIEGQIVFVNAASLPNMYLYNKIVCIENADPGFEWIFTRGIKGLITKYGGANSHMTIRCSELDLPAAIGCGEQLFEQIKHSVKIELNCAGKILRPIHAC